MEINVNIKPPFIKLEQFLKFAGVSDTGGQAKIIIKDGEVKLNGNTCSERGKKLFSGDIVSFGDINYRVVINDS